MVAGTFTKAHSYGSLLVVALAVFPSAIACGSESSSSGPGSGGAGDGGTGAVSGRGGNAGTGGNTAGTSGNGGSSGNAGNGGGAGNGGSSGSGGKGGGAGNGGNAGQGAAGDASGNAGQDSGGAGANGGNDGESGSSGLGGEGSGGGCTTLSTPPSLARAVRSAGYSGTDQVYSTLYDVICTSLDDCVDTCVTAGGTEESCTQGSECPASSVERHCLPPTYWRNVAGALSESADTTEAAVQTQVVIAYHDPLILSDFGLSVPEGATVTGVEFSVRKASEGGFCIDESVRVLKDEMPIGAERKLDGAWPATTLVTATYGGENDPWDTTWTAAELNSPGFGLSITPVYTDVAGNDRAYVDSVSAVVHYTLDCE